MRRGSQVSWEFAVNYSTVAGTSFTTIWQEFTHRNWHKAGRIHNYNDTLKCYIPKTVTNQGIGGDVHMHIHMQYLPKIELISFIGLGQWQLFDNEKNAHSLKPKLTSESLDRCKLKTQMGYSWMKRLWYANIGWQFIFRLACEIVKKKLW